MSELFVLLWIADAIKSLQFLGALAALGMLLAFILGGFSLLLEDKIHLLKSFSPYAKWAAMGVCVIAALPSPTTVRALVAVKVGDYAVRSPLGEKTIKTLETLLDRVVDDKRKGDE